MIYLCLFLSIVVLSHINIDGKYFNVVTWLLYISYIVLAFLLLNNIFADELRHFLRGIFEHFGFSLDYAEERSSERNMKNLDLVYYMTYGFAALMFLINLISIGTEHEKVKAFPLKKQILGFLFLYSVLFLAYFLFDRLSSMDPEDMRRVNSMTSYRLGQATNKVGIVFITVGVIVIASLCAVYIKLFVIKIKHVLVKIHSQYL